MDNNEFDPTLFGFEVVESSKVTKRDYCYLRYGKNGSHNNEPRRTMTLVLDETTSDLVTELFGKRAKIAVNDRAQVVISKGNSRALSRSAGEGKRVQISLGVKAEKFLRILGEFSHYEVVPKDYADWNAIIFTPKRLVD